MNQKSRRNFLQQSLGFTAAAGWSCRKQARERLRAEIGGGPVARDCGDLKLTDLRRHCSRPLRGADATHRRT